MNRLLKKSNSGNLIILSQMYIPCESCGRLLNPELDFINLETGECEDCEEKL